MIPHWVKNYVGLPFEHCNCWQLVCRVYRDQLGIRLPFLDDDYSDPYDKTAIAKLYEAELARVWQRIAAPEPFACIVFRIQNQLWHVGLCLDADNMLHSYEKIDAAVERFTTKLWQPRIEGFYTYIGLTP